MDKEYTYFKLTIKALHNGDIIPDVPYIYSQEKNAKANYMVRCHDIMREMEKNSESGDYRTNLSFDIKERDAHLLIIQQIIKTKKVDIIEYYISYKTIFTDSEMDCCDN